MDTDDCRPRGWKKCARQLTLRSDWGGERRSYQTWSDMAHHILNRACTIFLHPCMSRDVIFPRFNTVITSVWEKDDKKLAVAVQSWTFIYDKSARNQEVIESSRIAYGGSLQTFVDPQTVLVVNGRLVLSMYISHSVNGAHSTFQPPKDQLFLLCECHIVSRKLTVLCRYGFAMTNEQKTSVAVRLCLFVTLAWPLFPTWVHRYFMP